MSSIINVPIGIGGNTMNSITALTRDQAEKIYNGLIAHNKTIRTTTGKAVYLVEHTFDIYTHDGFLLSRKGTYTVWWWRHFDKDKDINEVDIEEILFR